MFTFCGRHDARAPEDRCVLLAEGPKIRRETDGVRSTCSNGDKRVVQKCDIGDGSSRTSYFVIYGRDHLLGVAVIIGVLVAVGVFVGVEVTVGVFVGVWVSPGPPDVSVAVGVAVIVGVLVAVAVGVLVGVL